MGSPGTVFLSHSSSAPDFAIAHGITERLRAAGLDVWWDADKLEAGNHFTAEIVEAIIKQYHFLFLLSIRSVRSQWCKRELARAVELGKTIIPVTVEQVAPPDTPLELAGLQYIDVREGLDHAMPALHRAVGLGLSTTYDHSDDPFARDGRMLHAIVEQLPYAKTFTDSLNLVRLLSNIAVSCSETERARNLFATMCDMGNFRELASTMTKWRIIFDGVGRHNFGKTLPYACGCGVLAQYWRVDALLVLDSDLGKSCRRIGS